MLPALVQPIRGQRMHRENEKSNLVVVCRLVLRAFLEDALGTGRRMVEGETQLISDLLIVLEKVLWHGFKGGKSILPLRSVDADLWATIKKLSTERVDVAETVNCVDQLEQLLTPISRIRCLLRLIMMQKKIVDLFQTIANSPLLKDFYEPWSLLRSDESIPLIGSLLGLSVVDCSLLVEYDHLQEQPSSVDLSMYIKIPSGEEQPRDEDAETRQRRLLLEQNSYLEERNRQLLNNLENMKLKIIESEKKGEQKVDNGFRMRDLEIKVFDREEQEEREIVEEEKKMREKEEWDKERQILHAKISQKEDEVRMYKQQVEDTKEINKDLYEKVRLSEDKGRKRERELVAANQHIAEERDDLLERLELQLNELRETQSKGEMDTIMKEQFEGKCEQYTKTMAMLEKKQKELKETRETAEELRRWKESAIEDMERLKQSEEDAKYLSSELERTKERMEDLERTLEEMGGRLSESQLLVLDLKEELLPSAPWQDDSAVNECKECKTSFGLTVRKHHCRRCGFIFCNGCSSSRVRMSSLPTAVRVCDACLLHLKANLAI